MKYQVLIVDDEEIVCRGLSQFVKWSEHGFEVAGIAHSADDALTLAEKLPVDVVFMDIRMPGKSGLELLKILRQETPAVKCVILSGFSDFSYAQEALRYGASDYLTKPVNLREVETLLDRLCMEFEEEQKEMQIHTHRMEALLLSAAKGYAAYRCQSIQFPYFKPLVWSFHVPVKPGTVRNRNYRKKRTDDRPDFFHPALRHYVKR